MSHLKFYLRPTSTDKNSGVLSHYHLDGTKVLGRKSYGFKIPNIHWDKKSGRVKKTYMQADEINQMIEEVIKKFNHDQSLGGTTPDDQCALILFSNEIKRSRDLNNISAGTEYKYHTVLRNFKEVAVKLYGEEYLPFKLFRDIKEIEKLKVEIRLSRRNGKPKKNKAVRSYMSQFASVVHRWNSISGTQNPINILPFTTDIVVEKPQKVLVPEINQIHELVEYTPKGHRGGKSEMIAKSVFLFQYYCSGIRFQDAILATNKSYKSGSLYVRIRKTDNYSKFEVHYPMIQSLKQLYPDLFKEVNECVTLSSLKLPVKTLANLAQIGYQNPIPTWNLEDLNKIEQMVQQNDDTFSVEMGEKIFEIKNKLQDFITKRFFEKLFEGDEHFLFPYLVMKDFKNIGLDYKKFTKIHEKKIQRCRSRHNSSLKRVSKNSGIEGLRGHTPRHAVARHLKEAGYSSAVIQETLQHASEKNTIIYLGGRHYNQEAQAALRKFYQKGEQ